MKQVTQVRQITEGPILRQILIFFFPILLGTFFQQMYNTADTIIVGRFVSTEALAAVGSTGPLVNMINGFFIGISSGATVILSQFFGAGNKDGVVRALHTGVMLSIVLGLMIVVLGCCFAPLVLRFINTPADCLPLAQVYIRICFAGAIGSMVYNMGAGILRAMGDSRRPMIFLIVSCFINIAADILFVVVLDWKVVGAALATVLSQAISAGLLMITLVRSKECPLRFSALRMDPALLRRILGIGVPAGLSLVTFDLSNVLVQSGINSFGSATMAAWTAFGKTDAITWMISGAFGVSITTFVGQNFGAQKYRRVQQSVWTCMALSLSVVGLLAAFEYVFRRQILGICTPDAEVIEIGAYMMSIIVPFNPLFMPIEILSGTMRGTGYSVVPTVITGLSVCLFRVVWLMTVVFRWHSLMLLCLSYPISWLLAVIVFFIVYFRGNWLRKRIAACGMDPEVR